MLNIFHKLFFSSLFLVIIYRLRRGIVESVRWHIMLLKVVNNTSAGISNNMIYHTLLNILYRVHKITVAVHIIEIAHLKILSNVERIFAFIFLH